MADKHHLDVLALGASTWNVWRLANKHITPSLGQVELDGANLSGYYLQEANFYSTRLRRADLSGANLTRANLQHADLTEANLRDADLWMVNLGGTDLRGADLTNCVMGESNLCEVDLSDVVGLETVRHGGPSTIGIDTIYKSKGRIPESFLRQAGVPENFIAYARSLVATALDFYSCFISFSKANQGFAERLYTDLRAKGVRCWYFPEDAKWGQPVWGEIDRSIRAYDKVIVICSTKSLQSGPVNREIERALQREDLDRRHILFPIRIDDYLFEKWDHPRKADVVSKVVGDFRRWKDHDAYTKALNRLLRDLKSEERTQAPTKR